MPRAQNRMEHVGDRVVALDVRAPLRVDRGANGRAFDHLRRVARDKLRDEDEVVAVPDNVSYLHLEVRSPQRSRVRNLPSTCRVERIVLQNDQKPVVPSLGVRDCRAHLEIVIADESTRRTVAALGAELESGQGRVSASEPTCGARQFPLTLHRRRVARVVDAVAAFARDQLGEVGREPVGVVETEDHIARH